MSGWTSLQASSQNFHVRKEQKQPLSSTSHNTVAKVGTHRELTVTRVAISQTHVANRMEYNQDQRHIHHHRVLLGLVYFLNRLLEQELKSLRAEAPAGVHRALLEAIVC